MKTKAQIKRLEKILDKICLENGIERNNVYVSEFGYVCTVDMNKKDADFKSTIYGNKKYQVQYVSGCFNPFIVEVN